MLVVLAVVASAVCLVLGLTVGPFVLVWAALALGLAGLALFILPVARRRAPGVSTPDAGTETSQAQAVERRPSASGDGEEGDGDGGVAGAEESDDAVVAVDDAAPSPPAPGSAVPVSPGPVDPVLVVPGRLRFHAKGCALLADRPSEAISLAEALEEGFSPCTACIPDRSVIGATP